MNASNGTQGQAPDVNEATSAEGQAPEATQAPSQDWQAEAERWKAEAKKLREEAAAKRVAAKEAREREAAELEKRGELEQAHQLLKSQFEEAKAFEQDAIAWREFTAKESERLNEKAEVLPDWQRAAFDALPTLDAKRNFLEHATAKPPEPEPKKPMPGASAPGAAPQMSLADMSPEEIRALRAANPAQLEELYMAQAGTQKRGSLLGSMLQRKKP